MRLKSLAFLGIVALPGCTTESADGPQWHGQSKNVPADVRAMWKTQPLESRPKEFASTERAIDAADRVFATVHLIGLTRPQVIALVGDPRTSSNSTYNFPWFPPPKGALVYRFDTGAGGFQFNVLFDGHGLVRKIERLPLGDVLGGFQMDGIALVVGPLNSRWAVGWRRTLRAGRSANGAKVDSPAQRAGFTRWSGRAESPKPVSPDDLRTFGPVVLGPFPRAVPWAINFGAVGAPEPFFTQPL